MFNFKIPLSLTIQLTFARKLLFCESNEMIKFRTVSNIGTLNTTNGKFDYRDAFVEFKIVNVISEQY